MPITMRYPLVTNNVYHVMNKSIADYHIFNSDTEYAHMIQVLRFFSYKDNLPKFSRFSQSSAVQTHGFEKALRQSVNENKKLVQFIAYCIMPTHIHLLLKQLVDDGISLYAKNILNTYTRYFNTKHSRKGPLWESRFKSVPVSSDEQLLHVTRYIHLNPVSAGLVQKAEQWPYSSYLEYTTPKEIVYPLCDFRGLIEERPAHYRAFVSDHADYQRKLARIKKLALE